MTVESIPGLVDHLRASFDSGRTRPLSWRIGQLQALRALIKDNETAICEAVESDMGRPYTESYIAEVGSPLSEINHILKNLSSWVRNQHVPSPLANFPSRSYIQRDPLGVILIIGPWNYPIQLLLTPLADAIAAGNCVLMKPSELAPNASKLLSELVPKYMDKGCVSVVEGGIPESTALLAQRYDHIVYTGGGAVARIVMEAAAKHLTPVTLELGGKSPCYVASDADLKVAADRICWGKYTNAGQTCIAPDYILVEASVEKALLAELKSTITDFFGDNPQESKDFGRIINERHHQRLCGLLEGQEAFVGGETDEATRYIAPTVLHNVSEDSKVMSEEIFGPILPVLVVQSTEDVIRFVNKRPRPLALYIFSENAGTHEKVLRNTVSGGVCINDTVSHFAVHGLPFGGVGNSGIGAYHGKHGFDSFSHAKAVVNRSTTVDVSLRYAPYTDMQLKIIRKFI